MISTFLVEELSQLAERSSQMTLAYYFCDDKNERRRTATAILRGLLLQLLRQRPVLFKHIRTDFDMSRDRLFADFHALWRIFASIVKDPEAGEVYCLIDALDECEQESRHLFLTNFTKLFGSQQSTKTRIKFILTSRRESDIVESISAISPAIWNLQIDSGKINNDLFKFIDVKVDELCKYKGYTPGLKEKIKSALTEKAGGTFLYVSLVLHDLKKTRISAQVTKKLEDLPLDLEQVYDRILRQIDTDCVEIATTVLRWVAIARRPLTVDELAMALVLSIGEWEKTKLPSEEILHELQDAFKCCEPLVYVGTGNHTINLVHQSAKDYLLGTYLQYKDGLSQYHIVTDRANLDLFRICWKYLSLEEFEHGRTVIERDAENILQMVPIREYTEIVLKSVPVCRLLEYAAHTLLYHAYTASLALASDLEFWMHDLGQLPNLRDFWLLVAAREGHEMVVQRLLEHGAEPNVKVRDNRTPLSWAALRGHEKIVKQLLSQGNVEVNVKDKWARTPLSYAAESGHEAIAKLLLSRDDVIADSQDMYDERTPLIHAVVGGYETLVESLLSRDDVLVDSRDFFGKTPLSYAAQEGYETVVKLLLSRNDVIADSRCITNRTPLSYAAEGGYDTISKLLLSRDDVAADSQDDFGMTPLSYAIQGGHQVVVNSLEQKMRDSSNAPRKRDSRKRRIEEVLDD